MMGITNGVDVDRRSRTECSLPVVECGPLVVG